MIRTRNLTVTYGDKVALSDISLHIRRGEKVSLIGKSGCGKTTLLHGIAGLLKPFEGSITINDKIIDGIRESTAIILQKDGLFPWKKVEANVLLSLINEPITLFDKKDRVHQLLKELEIYEYRDKYLHELSGGQRQRVAIARALIQKPDLLLMDEPTGALDMITKEKFQDSLHELYEEYAMTTLLVTHDIEEAVYLGQRILIMVDGKIVNEVNNPHYGKKDIRESLAFYELCLHVRQVMKC